MKPLSLLKKVEYDDSQKNLHIFFHEVKDPIVIDIKHLLHSIINEEDIIRNIHIIHHIQKEVEKYLVEFNIKSLVIGISGGFDSGFNAAILKPVCDKLNIPLIGRYIHIETNKKEEKERADAIGAAFCTNYQDVDLTKEYEMLAERFMGEEYQIFSKERPFLITLGNIKARMRMLYLYNVASLKNGIVVDNDNKSEWNLGFRTLHGDEGDITPIGDIYKTDAYNIAKCYLETLTDENERKALQAVIDAVPTDGLGITSSDVEQFGVDSYDEVDNTLRLIEDMKLKYTDPCPFTDEKEIKIWQRWKNSRFKRNHPYKIQI